MAQCARKGIIRVSIPGEQGVQVRDWFGFRPHWEVKKTLELLYLGVAKSVAAGRVNPAVGGVFLPLEPISILLLNEFPRLYTHRMRIGCPCLSGLRSRLLQLAALPMSPEPDPTAFTATRSDRTDGKVLAPAGLPIGIFNHRGSKDALRVIGHCLSFPGLRSAQIRAAWLYAINSFESKRGC